MNSDDWGYSSFRELQDTKIIRRRWQVRIRETISTAGQIAENIVRVPKDAKLTNAEFVDDSVDCILTFELEEKDHVL